MKTILVDDEQWGLKRFELECAEMTEIEVVGMFMNAEDAYSMAKDNRVDLALLDIEMPGINGMDLADKLRALYPDIIIIFISAFEGYFKEAIKVRKADYFLLKPYTADEVKSVLETAKLLSARQKSRVRIHTFGSFEVYVDDVPIQFTSEKAKELLAIMVDARGESVSTESAFYIMWEDVPYNHTNAGRYRKTLQKLQTILSEAGIENILSYFPHARAIKKDAVECDLYDLLAEKANSAKSYNGAYMSQYSWGEEKIFLLDSIAMRIDPSAGDRLNI